MSPREFKRRWRNWLVQTIATTRSKLQSAQQRYRRNYDERLRLHGERIKIGDHVYLRVERKEEKQTRHKLAPVAEGPFKVKDVKDNTVVIVNASQDHV